MMRRRSVVWVPCFAVSLAAFAACGGPEKPPARPPAPAASASASASAAPPPTPPPGLAAAEVDRMLEAAWAKEGLTPAPVADDATFVRRAYLDIVGTIPSPEVARAFAADAAPDKRKRLVDSLLASPAYATHWAEYWDDVLMGREVREPTVDRAAFRAWLLARFSDGTSWDKIVTELVSGVGQNSNGGPRARALAPMPAASTTPMGAMAGGGADAGAAPAGGADEPDGDINPAVNWALRFNDAPVDLAGNASRTFLGVQIQCAQCHDHKTEAWKQADFQRFASAVLHAQVVVLDKGKPMGMVKRVQVKDLGRVLPRVANNPELSPIGKARATALDGTDLEKGEGTRKALARWMTSPQNPYFARAFVNRMWGHFLGRGFVDPVDDIRPSNPAAAPEVLDALAADFVKGGYDVKRLVRLVATTRAYGLSASAQAKTDPDNHLWAKFKLTPLAPPELLAAIFAATDVEAAARRAGIQNIEQLRAQISRSFSFVFDVDEELDAHDYSGTVTQALTLLNGALVGHGSRAIPGSALADIVAQSKSNEEAIDAIYWRVLSRPPSAEERAAAVKYVQDAANAPAPAAAAPAASGSAAPAASGSAAKPPKVPAKKGGGGPLDRLAPKRSAPADPRRAALEDIFWALLNSSEFLFNH